MVILGALVRQLAIQNPGCLGTGNEPIYLSPSPNLLSPWSKPLGDFQSLFRSPRLENVANLLKWKSSIQIITGSLGRQRDPRLLQRIFACSSSL
jgi:hypothetical protein